MEFEISARMMSLAETPGRSRPSTRFRDDGGASRDQRKINGLDLNPAILYPKHFALVDARMILAEPAIRPRAVDI
jgi:hypothetical protein